MIAFALLSKNFAPEWSISEPLISCQLAGYLNENSPSLYSAKSFDWSGEVEVLLVPLFPVPVSTIPQITINVTSNIAPII